MKDQEIRSIVLKLQITSRHFFTKPEPCTSSEPASDSMEDELVDEPASCSSSSSATVHQHTASDSESDSTNYENTTINTELISDTNMIHLEL